MNQHSDIIVVGAGPAGLSFARTLADSGLNITIVEKAPLESIENPAYDGREIALTHLSKEIMERLGMWQRVPENEIYQLKDAKVWNGTSSYQLYFPQPKQARGGATDRLGNLISNHNIRRAAYEAVKEQDNVTLLTGVGVKEARTTDTQAYVTLDNGETLTARLLVAADSRFKPAAKSAFPPICTTSAAPLSSAVSNTKSPTATPPSNFSNTAAPSPFCPWKSISPTV